MFRDIRSQEARWVSKEEDYLGRGAQETSGAQTARGTYDRASRPSFDEVAFPLNRCIQNLRIFKTSFYIHDWNTFEDAEELKVFRQAQGSSLEESPSQIV